MSLFRKTFLIRLPFCRESNLANGHSISALELISWSCISDENIWTQQGFRDTLILRTSKVWSRGYFFQGSKFCDFLSRKLLSTKSLYFIDKCLRAGTKHCSQSFVLRWQPTWDFSIIFQLFFNCNAILFWSLAYAVQILFPTRWKTTLSRLGDYICIISAIKHTWYCRHKWKALTVHAR